jgi:hypothetical protein
MDQKCGLCGRLTDVWCRGCNAPFCRKHRNGRVYRVTTIGEYCWTCVCTLAKETTQIVEDNLYSDAMQTPHVYNNE